MVEELYQNRIAFDFAVRTNKYAFEFDYEKLTFNSFSIANTNTGVTNEPPRISFGIETYGKLYPCTHSSLRTEDCQLIHTGRFLQHRFINWIPELTGCDPYNSGLEIISWNDRLTLSLRIIPTVIQRSNAIVIKYSIPSTYIKQTSPEGWAVYKHMAGTDGYIITGSTDNTFLSFSGNNIEARLHSDQKLQPGQLYQTGLIIYPVENLEKELVGIINQETNPLKVTAIQTDPVSSSLETQYDPVIGWHSIQLRNDISGNITKDNDRMERIKFTIENDNPKEATIRLNFSKEKEVYAVPGISGIIRDKEGFPTGIPIQLSKTGILPTLTIMTLIFIKVRGFMASAFFKYQQKVKLHLSILVLMHIGEVYLQHLMPSFVLLVGEAINNGINQPSEHGEKVYVMNRTWIKLQQQF